MTTRPFKILGLQQIAIGGLDLDALRTLWVDTFGVPKVGDFTSESENVSEDILRLGEDPLVEFQPAQLAVEELLRNHRRGFVLVHGWAAHVATYLRREEVRQGYNSVPELWSPTATKEPHRPGPAGKPERSRDPSGPRSDEATRP